MLLVLHLQNQRKTSCYRCKNLAGIQFHPEKSQENGILFLNDLIEEMLNG